MEWGFKRHLDVYAGCQRYADEAGWDCAIHPAPERALAPRGRAVAFDGVIARATPALAAAAGKAGVPVVNVWLNSPAGGLPSVFPDFEASGAMAAEHLLARGFRQFGYLGYTRDIDSRQQLAGFRRAIRAAGYTCASHRFSRGDLGGKASGWEQFASALGAWIDSWHPPIGVFVANDLYCRYLIDVCRAKGLHVSQQVAIVGTMNEQIICESPPPTLTSIDLGFDQIGYRAAAMLDRLMGGGQPPAEPELVPPAELVPRQSTDVYAAADPVVARALRFIAEGSGGRMKVPDVAAAAGVNRRTLERRFRDALGRTIADEIARLRIERAKRRMVETDAPIKDVALDAGFRCADHFYKVFSRLEGMPPTEYRAEHQKAFPKRVGVGG
ncbi:MAG: XylR family transcriptional regulator [Verrucomicrobiales bacterium]